MKRYTATVSILVPITARNDEQAQERATTLQEAAANGLLALRKPWIDGDMDYPEPEIEEEES